MKLALVFIRFVLFADVIFAHYRILSTRQIADLVENKCVLLISSDYKFDDADVEIRLENFSRSFENEFVSLAYSNFDEFFDDPYVHVKPTNAGKQRFWTLLDY